VIEEYPDRQLHGDSADFWLRDYDVLVLAEVGAGESQGAQEAQCVFFFEVSLDIHLFFLP
jgi:hypothetical protein